MYPSLADAVAVAVEEASQSLQDGVKEEHPYA
jgi:hypothetical protein